MDQSAKSIPNEVYYILILIILLIINLTGLAPLIRSSVNLLFTPIMTLSYEVGGGISSTFEALHELGEIRHQRNELLIENAQLKAENGEVRVLVDELNMLKEELQLRDKKLEGVEAAVLAVGHEGVKDYLIINRGGTDGVKEGSSVRVGNVFIGAIEVVESTHSIVALPTGSNSFWEVSVIPDVDNPSQLSGEELQGVLRSGKNIWRGVTAGSSTGLQVENIEGNADIKVGDSIFVTDREIPERLYLGDVGSVEHTPSAVSIKVSVMLPFDYKNLTKVIVSTSE